VNLDGDGLGMEMKSVGMCVISVPLQVSSLLQCSDHLYCVVCWWH